MKLLYGKNAVITGTNRGIGKAIVEVFAHNGCRVFACARKPSEEFETFLLKLSKKENVKISPVYFDLSNSSEIKEKYKIIKHEADHVDILVNCAGISNSNTFQMTSMEQIRDIFDVNVFSTMELTQYFLKIMTRQKRGCVVNVASISGIDANPGKCVYGSSKAAIIQFTKALASEVGRQGIRVNAVAPGPTDTDMIKKTFSILGDSILERSALKRLAQPEEIANVVAFLASDKASFVNGQVIRVDGGSQ